MQGLRIYVVGHKAGMIPVEGACCPIHVGRAGYVRRMMAEGGKGLGPDDPMADMIGDDTGENISLKNPGECEKYVQPSPYKNAQRALAYMAELLTGVYFIHRGLRIKSVPYYWIENGKKVLRARTEDENRRLAMYEGLLQNELAEKVKEDRREKFRNPAILLGLGYQ